jgi:multidrug efflux pump subunit AcrA (membrane-fusion protein)
VIDGRAAIRPVELGLKGEDYYEIKSALDEGEQVIVSPDGAVTHGVRVRVN